MRTHDTRLFKTINQLTSLRKCIPALKTPSGDLTTTAQEKSNMFALFYGTIQSQNNDMGSANFDHEVEQTVRDFLSQQMTTEPSTESVFQIRKIIDHLKNRKSPGLVRVTNIMLKNLPLRACERMTEIINFSQMSCHWPASWKLARCICIPNPGKNLDEVSSYRTISLSIELGQSV